MIRLQLRHHLRKLPAGEVIVRGGVFLLGAALIGLGLALSVLPGPLTIPPVLLGLMVWSLEFDFAKRLLERMEVPAQKAWDQAKAHPWRTGVVSGSGLIAAVVLSVVAVRQDWIRVLRDALT